MDEFDPDRWENVSGDMKDPFTFGSFHSGPRICIGKSFALLEYKVILIRLLQNLVIEDPAQKPLESERGLSTCGQRWNVSTLAPDREH